MFWKSKSNQLVNDVEDFVDTPVEPAIATVDEPEEDVQETTAEVSTEETAAEAERNEWFLQLKSELHRQVIGKMDLATLGTMAEDELRLQVRRSAEELLRTRSDLLNVAEQERLVEEVIDETFGLGPLEPLFRDESITDIMINGPDVIYIERGGRQPRQCDYCASGHRRRAGLHSPLRKQAAGHR